MLLVIIKLLLLFSSFWSWLSVYEHVFAGVSNVIWYVSETSVGLMEIAYVCDCVLSSNCVYYFVCA